MRTLMLLTTAALLAACAHSGPQTMSSPEPQPDSPEPQPDSAKPGSTSAEAALGEKLISVIAEGKPNSVEEVQRLLRAGAPVDYAAGTPLNVAAYNNDFVIVRLLVAAGATINASHRSPQEESVLEFAIRSPYGDPWELVQFLVEQGADVDTETEGAEADPGSSPQLAAIRRCNPQVLAYLRTRSHKRIVPSADEICRDQAPPNVPASHREAILELVGQK